MAAAACSCSTAPTTTPSTIARDNGATRSATLACLPKFAPGTSEPDGSLVGMPLTTAESRASSTNQTARIVAQDGNCTNVTSDLVSNRVDLWIVNGRVIKAVVEGSFGQTSST